MLLDDGQKVSLDKAHFSKGFSPERFTALISKILYGDRLVREERLKALWSFMSPNVSDYAKVRSVNFYEVLNTTTPEEKFRNPLSRELIYQLSLK